MGKHNARSYDEKKRIVEEQLNGSSYSQVSRKYNVRSGTITTWKKKYLEGTLRDDNRGKPKHNIDDVEILKK